MEKEEPVKNKKKKIIVVTTIIIALLVLIVGVSYALWQQTRVQEDTNIIASGCFGVTIEGNEGINLANTFPITTEDGMKTKPYTFTITNTCSEAAIYDVNLESLSTTTHQNESIRVALDDMNKLYSEYNEAEKYYSTSKNSKILTSGALASGESVTYNLRIWIDESVTNEEQNKTFESKIVITSSEAIEATIENLNATSTIDTINITYQTNGDVTPATCKWGTEEGTYTNAALDVTSTNCNIRGLSPFTTYYYEICTETGKGSKCEEGNVKTKLSISAVEIGDYISMTPTSTSYTLPDDLSGCDGTSSTCVQNTINPSELNLWRVISKNEDGTVDIVSEYVSSKAVYFRGQTGWNNYLKGLNTIAAQYTNEKYVQSTKSVENSSPELSLISGAVGSLIGYPPDGSGTSYRYYLSTVNPNQSCGGNWRCYGVYRCTGGIDSVDLFRRPFSAGQLGEVTGENATGNSVRPIVTLKSNVEIISGNGQSADTAYSFE